MDEQPEKPPAVEMSVIFESGEQIVTVHDVGGFDSVLDRFIGESDPQEPPLITVTRGDFSMNFAQGTDWALLDFIHSIEDGEWPEHASLGDRHAVGDVVAIVRGQWSELPRWMCIPPALAREAMRHSYLTGGLWPRIAWVPPTLYSDVEP